MLVPLLEEKVFCSMCNGADAAYRCDICGVTLCKTHGEESEQQEIHAHREESGQQTDNQSDETTLLARANENEKAIAEDDDLSGESTTLSSECHKPERETCPSCGYPRRESADWSCLEYLERNKLPLTKVEFDKVNMSGSAAHCVVPQTVLRSETRSFLGKYYGDQSPCDLLEESRLPAVKKAYKEHMKKRCLQAADPQSISMHLEEKTGRRPSADKVRKRVDKLPADIEKQEDDEEAEAANVSLTKLFTTIIENRQRNMKSFVSRYPVNYDDVLVEKTMEKGELKGYLISFEIAADDGDGRTVFRRKYRANGKACKGKGVNTYTEYNGAGDVIDSGDTTSMAKAANTAWHANVFKNLMKSHLTVGSQCAYCEGVQGDFTLAERYLYAMKHKGTPPEFVGMHLSEAVRKAGGLKPYMDSWLDGCCRELESTLKVACKKYPKKKSEESAIESGSDAEETEKRSKE